MKHLQTITIQLPKNDVQFIQQVQAYLSPVSTTTDSSIEFHKSNPTFTPHITIEFCNKVVPSAYFVLNTGETTVVELINKTGVSKKSPHAYTPISLEDFIKRLKPYTLKSVDHVGFDIPWFNGIHPEIIALRKVLSQSSLYFLFPSGEPWDFILPGSSEEIANKAEPDLTMHRKPKFEIVSIDKVSTPIIQIELEVAIDFQTIVSLFPEGIAVAEVNNSWVYIDNPFGLDFCMVINEHKGSDWSSFFAGKRL